MTTPRALLKPSGSFHDLPLARIRAHAYTSSIPSATWYRLPGGGSRRWSITSTDQSGALRFNAARIAGRRRGRHAMSGRGSRFLDNVYPSSDVGAVFLPGYRVVCRLLTWGDSKRGPTARCSCGSRCRELTIRPVISWGPRRSSGHFDISPRRVGTPIVMLRTNAVASGCGGVCFDAAAQLRSQDSVGGALFVLVGDTDARQSRACL